MKTLRCLCLVLLACCPALADERTRDKNGKEPEEVLVDYFLALRAGHLEEAAGLVWLEEGKTPQEESDRFKTVAQRMKRDKWDIHVVAKAVDKPFAAIVYTKDTERTKPEPIMLVLVEDTWKLHHRNVSGRLSHRVDKSEYNKISGLIRWGNDKCLDIKKKAAAENKAKGDGGAN